jgi:hypothetical protein
VVDAVRFGEGLEARFDFAFDVRSFVAFRSLNLETCSAAVFGVVCSFHKLS